MLGALGISGSIACKVVKVEEVLLYPFVLRASTVNSYVVPKVKLVAVKLCDVTPVAMTK